MDMSIRTNLGSSLLANALNRSLGDVYQALERLSSGRRLNRASDGPAELVISINLESQIAGLNSQIEGITATINKYESVSSSVLELRQQLTELRTLAIEAVNAGGIDETAQEALASTAELGVENYNQAIRQASYNGQATLDGSEGSLAEVAQLSGVDLSTPTAAAESIAVIDSATSQMDRVLIDLGATQKNELESQRRSLETSRQNLMAAQSTITDTDYALEISNFVAAQIRSQAAMAMLGQSLKGNWSVVSLLES